MPARVRVMRLVLHHTLVWPFPFTLEQSKKLELCERVDGTLELQPKPDRVTPRTIARVDASSAEARPLFGSGLGRPTTALEAER